MSKELDRASLVKEICKAARLYKEHLVGNRFLYAFDGRYIEVLYKVANFKHLTGVETNLSAKKFYEYAVKNQLQDSLFCTASLYALYPENQAHLSSSNACQL